MGLTSFLWAKDGVGTFLYIILLLLYHIFPLLYILSREFCSIAQNATNAKTPPPTRGGA